MDAKENISKILSWNRMNALIVLIAFFVSVFIKDTLLLALFSLFSFCTYMSINRKTFSELKPYGGYANWVTFLRFLLLITVMFSWNYIPNVLFVGLLVLFVCLDGVDGWMARKYNQVTSFGQYFDMEIDALFVLFGCMVLYLKGIAGEWILIPGGLRYVFVAYTWIVGPSKQKEERRFYGAAIAVSFFISILISLAFQHSIQALLLQITGLLIVLSFGISFYNYRSL